MLDWHGIKSEIRVSFYQSTIDNGKVNRLRFDNKERQCTANVFTTRIRQAVK